MPAYDQQSTTERRPKSDDRQSDERRCAYSIIIPAYNESARIAGTLERVLAYTAERSWDAEIIVVNDSSRDNTADIVRSYMGRNPRLRMLENPGNRGKGYSVRNGMLHAQWRNIVVQ